MYFYYLMKTTNKNGAILYYCNSERISADLYREIESVGDSDCYQTRKGRSGNFQYRKIVRIEDKVQSLRLTGKMIAQKLSKQQKN